MAAAHRSLLVAAGQCGAVRVRLGAGGWQCTRRGLNRHAVGDGLFNLGEEVFPDACLVLRRVHLILGLAVVAHDALHWAHGILYTTGAHTGMR